jgi:hypothetical protein
MYKNFILSGCSFTHNDESWSHILEKKLPDSNVYNLGMPAAGNYIISSLCISKVSDLISSGVNPKEIFVIVQWSGLSRSAFVCEKKSPANSVHFDKCRSRTVYNQISGENSRFCWNINPRSGSKQGAQAYWDTYESKYWSGERSFIESLENILRVQWFLESKEVNYLMFNGWDIFTNNNSLGHVFKKNEKVKSQWSTDIYSNIENDLLKDIYDWSSHLWDMINFDKYFFFENEKVQLGGLLQFVQNSLSSKKEWYLSKDDPHPSYKGHKLFFENIIFPRLKEKS